MADNLKLNIDVNTQRSHKSVEELNKSLEKIESNLKDINTYSSKVGMENLPTSEIDKMVSSIVDAQRKLATTYSSANSRAERLNRDPGRSEEAAYRDQKDNIREISKLSQRMTSEMADVLKRFTEATDQDTPRYFGHNLDRHSYEPGESTQKLRSAQNTRRTTQNELTRTERQLRGAISTGTISDYQGRILKDSLNKFLGEYQGASTPEDIEKLREYDGTGEPTWFVDESSMRGQLERQMDSLNTEWGELDAQRRGFESQLEGLKGQTGEEADRNRADLEASLESVFKDMESNEKTFDNLQNTLETLNDSITRLTSIMGDEEDPTKYFDQVEVKPARDTLEGFLDTRGMTLGLSAINTFLNDIQTTIQGGRGVVEQQRDDSLTVGTSLGADDFRTIREEARDGGKESRVGGAELLSNADSYMRYIGIDGEAPTEDTRGELMEAAQAIASGQRTTGVSNEQWQALTGVAMESGATDSVLDLKQLQDAFVGGIQASGMEGREKEQVDALTALLDQVSSGRGLSEEQLRSQIAMTNLLAGTGSRALQGDNLRQNMGTLSETIQGASMFSDIGFLMGVGTNERYSGPEGMYNFMVDQQEGLAGEAGMEMVNNALLVGQGNTKRAASLLAAETGTDVLAAEEILNLAQEGQLTEENLKRYAQEAEDRGSETVTERTENFDESSDADQLMKQVAREDIDANIAENPITDMFNNFMAPFMGTMSGSLLTSALFAGGGGLLKGGGNVLRHFGGDVLKRGVGEATKGGLGTLGEGLSGSRMGKWFSNTRAGGKMASWFGATDDVAGAGAKAASKTVGKGAGLVDDVLPGLSKMTGTLGKGANFLGKAAPWIGAGIQAVQGIGEISEAEEGTKGEATGEVIGGIGGNLAGGAAGAALGSMLGPLGTLVGGVGGALLGDKALSAAGGWVGSKFDPDEEEEEGLGAASDTRPTADEIEGTDKELLYEQLAQHESIQDLHISATNVNIQGTQIDSPQDETDVLSATDSIDTLEYGGLQDGGLGTYLGQGGHGYSETLTQATTQDEQRIANEKLSAEELRQLNNQYEDTNLSRLKHLLKEMRNILAEARSVMAGAGGSGGGSGVGGELQYTDEGEYWTSSDITRHDLAYTSNTLTAGQLDEWISSTAPSNSIMQGMGEAFMEAGRQSGLDPRYLIGHAAHETAWGTSQIARDKGNMYGIGAFDASPYASAYGYNNTEAGIIEGANWISKNYYQDRGATDLQSMNVDYATDPGWARKIANTMRGSESYSQPSTVNVTTNVTVQGGRGADDTGNRVGNAVSRRVASTIEDLWTTDISRNYA